MPSIRQLSSIPILLNCLSASTFAMAEGHDQKKAQLRHTHEQVLEHLGTNSILQAAIDQRQNEPLSDAAIINIDASWPNDPFMSDVIQNTAAQVLGAYVKDTQYNFSELMLTDENGALIAAHPLTTDFWQGDEDKFKRSAQTLQLATTAESWDKSTQTYSYFISAPIRDEAGNLSGMLIGGVDITEDYLLNISIQEIMDIEIK